MFYLSHYFLLVTRMKKPVVFILQEGIEMQDSNDIDAEVEESVMDIDSCDKNNPLSVVEYINDIYCFYKKNEVTFSVLFLYHYDHSSFKIETFSIILQCRSCVPPNYMENQHDINERMRGILFDWLIEVYIYTHTKT